MSFGASFFSLYHNSPKIATDLRPDAGCISRTQHEPLCNSAGSGVNGRGYVLRSGSERRNEKSSCILSGFMVEWNYYDFLSGGCYEVRLF